MKLRYLLWIVVLAIAASGVWYAVTLRNQPPDMAFVMPVFPLHGQSANGGRGCQETQHKNLCDDAGQPPSHMESQA